MSSKDLLVSIVIPVKNRRELIAETLNSVQNQSHANWEAIVIDDESSDGTWQMLEEISLSDARIKPKRREGNIGGAAIARNQGVSHSSGEFILFLDSDDLLGTDAITDRLNKFDESPEADAIVGDVSYFRYTPGEYDNETKYLIRPVGAQAQ